MKSELKSWFDSLASVPKAEDGAMTMMEVARCLGVGVQKARALIRVGIKEGRVEVMARRIKNMVGVVTPVSVYRFKGKGRKGEAR